MKQEMDSLLEISAKNGDGGEHLTTDMSTHNDDPSQSLRTLGGLTSMSTADQRLLDSQVNLASMKHPSENGGSSGLAPS